MRGSGYNRPIGTLPGMRLRARFPRVTLSLVLVASVVLVGAPAGSVTKGEVDRACSASAQALRDLEAAQSALNTATAELNETYSRTEAVTASWDGTIGIWPLQAAGQSPRFLKAPSGVNA